MLFRTLHTLLLRRHASVSSSILVTRSTEIVSRSSHLCSMPHSTGWTMADSRMCRRGSRIQWNVCSMWTSHRSLHGFGYMTLIILSGNTCSRIVHHDPRLLHCIMHHSVDSVTLLNISSAIIQGTSTQEEVVM